MRSNLVSSSMVMVAAIAMLPLFDSPIQGQSKGKIATKPSAKSEAIPRTPDGKPDFQGVWQHPYVPDMSKDRQKFAARQAIRQRKSEDQWQEWIRQQRDKAYVEYHLDDK